MRQNLLLATVLALLCAVAAFPQAAVPLNVIPSRIVGHPNPEMNTPIASANPNLVEGRELLLPQGVALDTSVNPPILYVADTGNNRVLAWKDATSFQNGQPADLVIGQQDRYHTNTGGPGTTFSTGLNSPTSLAVYNGDLYIADTGNNRILRFRKPFDASVLLPDLYLGQPSLTSRSANYTGRVDATGIFFASGSAGYIPGLAFDANGNLWITDPGNRRVLRFDAADVADGGGPLQAKLVIGQLTFQDPLQPAVADANRTEARYFAIPQAVAFDSSGRLYVSDSYTFNTQQRGRVLVFTPPFSNAMTASRIMGVVPPNPPNPPSNDAQLRTLMGSPSAVFFINATSKIGVVDQYFNRILLFDSYEQWPDVSTSFSPVSVPPIVGQLTASNTRPNGATDSACPPYCPPPSDSVFYFPSAAAFAGNDLYVVDTYNHRVLDIPYQNGTFSGARAALGQDQMDMSAPNLIEGREFYFASSSADAGLAIDSTGDTPHLYVADTYNNRVLGFKDYRALKAGMPADIVIGQGDMKHGLCNGNGGTHPSATSLCLPTGLVVDVSGNLYVADSGNGRVLRFPAPFAHQGLEQADLVLGQRDFKTVITDPTQFTMARPYGLALSGNDGLLVSDIVHNRVLFFRYDNGGFSNGQAAEKVLGQPDFTTIKSGNGDRDMNAPHGIAADSEGRPYVTDSGNNRVLIFDQINNDQNGAPVALKITNLSSPRGVYVSAATGEAWITDTNNNGLIKKYPKFQTLLGNPASTATVQAAGPALAVAQDQYGDLVVADATNRVGFYYPGLQAVNGANFMVTRDLAPGMSAAICSPASGCDPDKRVSYFGPDTARADQLPNPLPLPTTLADVQVLFNGAPAPLYFVSPSQINFYVPMGAPTDQGPLDVLVVQKSTGRIYAAGSAGMNTYSPGIYSPDAGVSRQAAVINQDGTINSPTNPAARGSVISIYATGQGFIPNAPPDGSPAPSEPLLSTPFTPQVNFNGKFPEEYPVAQGDPPAGKFVQFSGLAPGYVGLWQINVYIPGNCPAGSQVPILVFAGSVASSDFSQAGFRTVIAVKNP